MSLRPKSEQPSRVAPPTNLPLPATGMSLCRSSPIATALNAPNAASRLDHVLHFGATRSAVAMKEANIAGKAGNSKKSTPKYIISNYVYVNEDPGLAQLPDKKNYVHLISITRDSGPASGMDRYTPAARVYRGEYFDESLWDMPMHAFDEASNQIYRDPLMQANGYDKNSVLDGYFEKRFVANDKGVVATLLPIYQKTQQILVAAFKERNAALVMNNTLGNWPVVGGEYDIKDCGGGVTA